MKAGRLNCFLTPSHLVTATDPESGAVTRRWTDEKEIRAERVKFTAKAVMRGAEGFIQADAVFYVRHRHRIEDGWRVRDRAGMLYDVVVEPDRENDLKLLKCTRVNE